jgi:hypothetical protein
LNTGQTEQEARQLENAPPPVDFNPDVRCAICRRVGFVARYCPCTKAGERRLRELAEKDR